MGPPPGANPAPQLQLGLCWPHVGRCWLYVGSMLADLGPMLADLGPVLADLGAILTYLARTLADLVLTWPQLGPNLAQLGPNLNQLEIKMESRWVQCGRRSGLSERLKRPKCSQMHYLQVHLTSELQQITSGLRAETRQDEKMPCLVQQWAC